MSFLTNDWDRALAGTREFDPTLADAMVQVLDCAWSVQTYLQHQEMPVTDRLILGLTEQVLARYQALQP
jgi:hypothetical protein